MDFVGVDSNEKHKIVRPHWTDIEIETLKAAYEKYGPNWKLIQQDLPGRTIQQCVQKWKRIKPIELVKQCRWSESEDRELKNLYLQHGPCWNLIAQKMENRNSVQVRQRYMSKLNPKKKSGKWTQQEYEELFDLYSKIGSKWAYIGQQLGGRADNDVKNRFYSRRNSIIFGEDQKYKSSKKLKFNESDFKENNDNQNQKMESFQQTSITDKLLIGSQPFDPIFNSIQVDEEFDLQESLQLSICLNENELIFYQTLSDQNSLEQINQYNDNQLNLDYQSNIQSYQNQNLESESKCQLKSQSSSAYTTLDIFSNIDEFRQNWNLSKRIGE